MVHPWPLPEVRDEAGNIVKATTPVDLQRIVGAQFVANGILSGLDVVGTSSMTYQVSAGAAFMWKSSSSRLGMLVPVEATTISAPDAPATGSRVDTIYVNGDGQVGRVTGTAIPSGIAIARFNVPAGVTSTSGAQLRIDRDWAIPYGASLGRLHRFHDPANGVWGNVAPMKLGDGQFELPSDRLVDFRLTWTASAEPAGTDQRTWGVARWFVYVEGPTTARFSTNWHYQGIHPRTEYMTQTIPLQQGTYRTWYVQERMGGARFRHHSGGPDGWLGNRFEVWDGGVSR